MCICVYIYIYFFVSVQRCTYMHAYICTYIYTQTEREREMSVEHVAHSVAVSEDSSVVCCKSCSWPGGLGNGREHPGRIENGS